MPGRHPRVIIADSYEAALRPCTRYLEHFSFDVVAVGDGRAVADEIDARPPAIVVMGTHLKDPSSEELLERATGRHGIPVILFADTMDDHDPPARFERSAASAVLVKPFALGALLSTIRDVLRAQAAARVS